MLAWAVRTYDARALSPKIKCLPEYLREFAKKNLSKRHSLALLIFVGAAVPVSAAAVVVFVKEPA